MRANGVADRLRNGVFALSFFGSKLYLADEKSDYNNSNGYNFFYRKCFVVQNPHEKGGAARHDVTKRIGACHTQFAYAVTE